jgi:hypothetical protein
MMDYLKTREEAVRRKSDLTARSQEIANERKRLDEEIENIEREMVGLDQIVEGLDFVASSGDLEPPPVPGLTEHIRTILQQTTVPLLPTQIRDSCLTAGIKATSDKNLLISVHNALRKMKPNLRESKIENKTAYIWRPSLLRVARRSRFTRIASRSALASDAPSLPRIATPSTTEYPPVTLGGIGPVGDKGSPFSAELQATLDAIRKNQSENK